MDQPMDVDWNKALAAMFSPDKSDTVPLSLLLRDANRPIPDTIREILSDLLDPSKRGFFGITVKLKLKNVENEKNNIDNDYFKLIVAQEFYRLRDNNVSYKDAIHRLWMGFGVDEGAVLKYKKLADKKFGWDKQLPHGNG